MQLNRPMRFLLLIILIILLAFLAMQRFSNPQLNHNSVLDRIQHPFDTRLRYKIGKIDPRFNISHEQLQNLARKATDIWFLGTQKQYFTYDSDAQLTINLIYDQRQAETEARHIALGHIENSRQFSSSEESKLVQLKSDLNMYQQQINQLKDHYQNNLNHFNHQVLLFNQSINQSEVRRQQLNKAKSELTIEQQTLQNQIDQFNQKVSVLNSQVNAVNHLNQAFNQSVDQFNQRFQPRLFDKGLFNGREINIYEFQSTDDLRITLAHEFGHTLGLLHSGDPKSLMFPILEKQDFQNFRLTQADLQLLEQRNN